jgi:hypothetical protein
MELPLPKGSGIDGDSRRGLPGIFFPLWVKSVFLLR